MLTNHGPLVKVRPSAAVVGIPFKRQGSLDGGQLTNVLAGQVQWELLSLSNTRSWLAFYLVAHVGTSPGNLSLPFLHQRGTTNTIMLQGKKWQLSSWSSDSCKHLLLWQVQHYKEFLIYTKMISLLFTTSRYWLFSSVDHADWVVVDIVWRSTTVGRENCRKGRAGVFLFFKWVS